MVSLLMAVHNAASYLSQAIDSVLGQTLSDWELLCVDDASSDDSLRILQEYAEQDERIKVFSSEQNCGPAHARNMALKHAQGEYITMLDADDWLSSDALERAVDVFRLHDDTDCVLLTLVEEYPKYRRPYPMQVGVEDVFTGEEAFRLSLDWRLHGLYLVRRELHLRYPYDESCRLHSDDNTTRIHYLHARQVRLCSGEYHYRKHEDSISLAVGVDHFGYLDANLSMARMLEQELLQGCVSAEDVAYYERYRWHQYVDKHWYFFVHRHAFSPEESAEIKHKLAVMYDTFTRSWSNHFGFCRCPNYRIFLIQEWLYFRLRWTLGRR